MCVPGQFGARRYLSLERAARSSSLRKSVGFPLSESDAVFAMRRREREKTALANACSEAVYAGPVFLAMGARLLAN